MSILTYQGANTFLPPSPVVPTFLVISAITNSSPMVVTVTTANSYVVDQLAYFTIPYTYGMFQLNTLTGKILAVDQTNLQITFDIDSTKFDPFVFPGSGFTLERPATLSPAGSRNLTNLNTNLKIVPFHALNGQVGN